MDRAALGGSIKGSAKGVATWGRYPVRLGFALLCAALLGAALLVEILFAGICIKIICISNFTCARPKTTVRGAIQSTLEKKENGAREVVARVGTTKKRTRQTKG